MQVPAEHMLVNKSPVNSNSNAPLLSEALTTYLKNAYDASSINQLKDI